jgi:putative phosphonate metabolism protein
MTVDLSQVHRYAVYFAPATGSAWWEAGSRWLGRCAATHDALAQPLIDGIAPEQQRQLTAEPRRYGWHATLKAPFSLGEGVSPDSLRAAMRALASTVSPFDLPPLRVRRLGGFLALCADGNPDAINTVARACVTGLQTLAAPLSSAELARRRCKDALSIQEDALLVRWGYPYVLDRYRFHLSLTGDLNGVAPDTVQRLERAARDTFEGLPACRFDSLALYAEPTPGADFVQLERMGFGQ